MPRPHRQRRERVEPYSTWVNAPLQNAIRDELDRRQWSISDMARMIGSQPSLISRWMQGQRPDAESVRLIAEALGLDQLWLMRAAGHITAPLPEEGDPRILHLLAKLRQVDLDEARYDMLDTMVERFRQKPLWTQRPQDADQTA